jgi:hypothetical protein
VSETLETVLLDDDDVVPVDDFTLHDTEDI